MPRVRILLPLPLKLQLLLFLYRRDGAVVQLVRTPACHAGGRGFKSLPRRQLAAIAQSVERILGKDEVSSSNLDSSSKKLLKSVDFGSFCSVFSRNNVGQKVGQVG